MKDIRCYTWTTLLIIASCGLFSKVSYSAETAQQSCAYYLGKDAETKTALQDPSPIKVIGVKAGLKVRKANVNEWVVGFVYGYEFSKSNSDSNTAVASIEQKVSVYCEANTSKTVLDAAKSLVK